jgi:5-aminopentanamidase
VKTSGSHVRVASAQVGASLGAVEENVAQSVSVLGDAAARGVDLVVFPECALSGYVFGDREQASQAAVGLDGPEVGALAAACAEHGLHAVVGLLEADRGAVYNAAVLLGPEGVVGSYRKAHLPCLGVDRFVARGEQREPAVFETALGRIGVAICYDLRFPETARLLALAGAELVAQPSNWPPQAVLLADHFVRVRAAENRVFVVLANRGDEEGGVEFIGRSQIVGPAGDVLASAEREEGLVVADVDLAEAREKRIVNEPGVYEVSLFEDRRPELYGALASGAPANGQRSS